MDLYHFIALLVHVKLIPGDFHTERENKLNGQMRQISLISEQHPDIQDIAADIHTKNTPALIYLR